MQLGMLDRCGRHRRFQLPGWSVRLVLYDGSVTGDLLLGAHFVILAFGGIPPTFL